MKKALYAFLFVLVVLIGSVVALVLFINPNQIKPVLVEQTQKQTGLDLVVEGDISWQFFPSLGFELGKTKVLNPSGFSQETLFSVDRVNLNVDVMPLFDNQVHIGNIVMDGAKVVIETKQDGSSNLDPLTQPKTSSSESENSVSVDVNVSPEQSQPWQVTVAGVTLSNAQVSVIDRKAGSETHLNDIQLTVSEFAFDQWAQVSASLSGKTNAQSFSLEADSEFKLSQDMAQYALRNIETNLSYQDQSNSFESIQLKVPTFGFDQPIPLEFSVKGTAADMGVETSGTATANIDKAVTKVTLAGLNVASTLTGDALPQNPMNIGLDSDVSLSLNRSVVDVVLRKLSANDIQLSGTSSVAYASAIPKIRFDLQSPNIDLDAFLASETGAAESKTNDSAESSGDGASTEPATSGEPDLSALKTLDLAGDLAIDQFKAGNASMQDVKVKLSIKDGVLNLNQLQSKLYSGIMLANAKLDATTSPAKYTAKGDLTGIKVQPLLKDVADFDTLEGTGNIDINLNGQSLNPEELKKNLVGAMNIKFTDGAVNGINIAQVVRENYAKIKGKSFDGKEGVQKTDFSSMATKITFDKGNVNFKDLAAQSPFLRVSGEGSANYFAETADMLVRTSIVGSLEGQGGKDIEELKDITIPIRISGPWTDLKYRPEFDAVLKQKAEKKISEKISEKIKDEDTKKAVDSLIKGLFN